MRKQLLSLFVLMAITFTQVYAWRPGEMQIRIPIENAAQYELLASLKLSMDFHGPDFSHFTAYVTPKELAQIEALGLNYEIEIADLNKYSKDFWETKDAYHSYQEIIDLADSLANNFPDICEKHIFGYSIENRQCAALKISDNVGIDEPEAEVMFDGGIHGDEIGCSENVIRFARDLCLGYGNDPTITNLIDDREIWLYLMVNPDGRVHDTRQNVAGVDLNRDWAYMWDGWGNSTGPCSQVESKALRECMYNNQFVIHTTYHSGTEYISCPWSYRPSQCPDYDHIIQLAGVYSSSSGYANLEYGQGCTGMYPINGSSKDSNYGIQGSISWSMEISNNKHPPASQIMMYYNYNYPSMITMIEYSGYGLEGTVTDINTGDPVTAVVFINDYFTTYTDPTCGDYHKYVLPGTYSITIVANGYQPQTIDNIVVTANSATSTDFQLLPEDKQYVFKLSASQIPDNNNADEGNTPGVIGAPDNINYSIGKNGWCVLDMQYPVIDGPGFDIIIFEGDASPEGFTCYVGETIDGPWISLGTGNGTTEFDIATSGLPEAQFIKIKDDGDGSANVADAGFDLDAIEALPPVSGIYLAMYEYVIDDSNGNNNGKIDPGETVDLIVTLKNNGDLLAENIQGEISTSSAFLTMLTDTASFGTLAQSQTGEGIFTVTAQANTPPGEPAEINLDVTSNGGAYNNSFIMNFVIGQIPVVIIDLDENHNSASEIKSAIETNGISVESLTSFPAAVDVYSTIFVCLGIYSDNHVLTSGEGQMLADFLNNGGNLYMEGGDTWFYDTQTPVHSMFNINATNDGSGDMSTVVGQTGTFTEGMSFNYSGDNNYMDHIDPISPAFMIFENQSPNYGTGVAYDEGSYRTIGTSHEFGGLDDGTSPSTKEELMSEYLEFLGISQILQASFASNTTYTCTQEIINFYDQSTGDPISWEWTFEGGSPGSSSNQNPLVVYFNPGTFDVTLTISDGVEFSTILMEDYMTVLTAPEIPATPEGPTSVTSYPGEISDYATMGSVNANTYTWNIEPAGAGTLIENDTSCSVDWTDYWEGIAYLKVKAINQCGESDFSESLEISCYISDIANISNNEIQIIPNPNDGRFTIHLGAIQPDKSELKILDNLGKIVYIKRLKSLENSLLKINLEELNSGFYFLILDTENSIIKEKIIIK